MRGFLIAKLIEALLKVLADYAPELIKAFADMILDWVEEYVLGSASKVDDALLLPICKMLRETFDIPDDD